MSAPHCIYRRDPSRNMARFYEIALRPNLFDEVTLVRTWGRIGTQGQTKLETFKDRCDAEAAAATIESAKQRRGYRPSLS